MKTVDRVTSQCRCNRPVEIEIHEGNGKTYCPCGTTWKFEDGLFCLEYPAPAVSLTLKVDYACPNSECGDPDFADPETQAFVPVESGTQPGTPHWAEGWIVCRKCGHTEWSGLTQS